MSFYHQEFPSSPSITHPNYTTPTPPSAEASIWGGEVGVLVIDVHDPHYPSNYAWLPRMWDSHAMACQPFSVHLIKQAMEEKKLFPFL